MTGGSGDSSVIRLGGDAPCPHPQLLLHHLFTSSGLSVCKALPCPSVCVSVCVYVCVTDSYMTHSHNIQTKESGCCSGVGVFFSPPTCILPTRLQTHTDSWRSCLLLNSCCKRESVAFWRVRPPLAGAEQQNSLCIMATETALCSC